MIRAALVVLLFLPWVPVAEASSDTHVHFPFGSRIPPDLVSIAAGDTVTFHTHYPSLFIEGEDGSRWCDIHRWDDTCTIHFAFPGAYKYFVGNSDNPDWEGGWDYGIISVAGEGGPVATIDSHAGGESLTGIAVFSGTVAASRGLSDLEFKVGGREWVPVVDGNTWTVNVDTAALPLGTYAVSIRALDTVAARSEESISVEVANDEYHDLEISSFSRKKPPAASPSNICIHLCIPRVAIGAHKFEFTAVIDHQGNAPVDAVVAMQYQHHGVWHDFDRQVLTFDPMADSRVYKAMWTNDGRVGLYAVRVVVDVLDWVAETDETNNEKTVYIEWFAKQLGRRGPEDTPLVGQHL